MIKIVICDDEFIFRDILKKYLGEILKDEMDQFEIIEFKSGEDLIENFPQNIDIFFLDIDMDGMTGMDLARKIRNRGDSSEIIFTTGLKDYIYEGYEVRAYRYLLKPIEFDVLRFHMNSCIKDIINKNKNNLIIQNKGELLSINIDEIMFVEVINKDIFINTKKELYNTKTSMRNIEKSLKKYNFYRCHKSFLVNINHIEKIDKNTIYINENKIPVSRHRKKDLQTKLLSTLGDILC